MSARSYLSIGDVLTLLRQEFPDVTISKIRFLESQGLVNPERTPSGYRKFYEHDVERLRWVLRQQREHFLPLKVIKDRLDEDAEGGERVTAAPDPAVTPEPAAAGEAAAATAEAVSGPVAAVGSRPDGPAVQVPATAEPVLVGHRASSPAPGAGAVSGGSPASSSLPGIESTATRAGTPTATTSAPPVERAHRASLAAQPSRAADAPAPAPANGSGNGSTDRTAPVVTAAGRSASRSSRAVAATAAPDPVPVATTPDPAPVPAPTPATSAPTLGGAGGVSLSLDELCAASGLRAEYVGQLQEYGLLRAGLVGGAEYFDEEALTVANVAAKLAAYGIEARHLRLYKNAADREAGFIEQIVIPLVRQRNPEARARATQTADELAGLGQQLKGSLLRTALRDLLNG